ncbi:MAG TPA: LuxR C-terminal-related transcriptional regulator [Acidimicrobiales bacterium]|nr:LuxR C-terminal-related transcriptional regulator [Acidimicrobiales bacterium]
MAPLSTAPTSPTASCTNAISLVSSSCISRLLFGSTGKPNPLTGCHSRSSGATTEQTTERATERDHYGMGPGAVSVREAEVLDALGRNRTNAEIAAELFISVRTVESHVSSLLRKLDAPNRQALARRAVPAGSSFVGAPGVFTSFVGRRRETEQLTAALQRSRLVTLTGPGGIGKTRLAVEVATSAPNRAAAGGPAGWFVDLLPARPEWVVQTVAAAVGVAEQPGRSLVDTVVAALSRQSGLLVLDNCEHVLDAAGELTGRLLRSCPSLRILATSREPISIPGEHVVTLGPMPVTADGRAGDAALLLAERSAAGGAPVDPEDPTVQEICARLDGMPLGIELAAVRCASLGLEAVREALVDRMSLLAGSRDVDERHRSLRATLDWSFGLLSERDRRLLGPLGVFAGWFGPADAAAVGDAGGESMLLALGRLASKSLLVRRDGPGGSWFRPLESVRAYLVERLAADGELDAVVARHASWATGQAVVLEKLMVSGGDWRPTLERILDDLRTALLRVPTRGLARAVAHLSYGRHAFMEAHAHYRLAATLADDPADAADDLLLAGHCAFGLGHGDAGYDAYLEAAETAARAGRDRNAAFALALAAARARRFRGLFGRDISRDDLEELYQRAVVLGGEADGTAEAQTVEAQLACARAWLDGPDFASAGRVASERAVAVCRATGDTALVSEALDALGAVRVEDGEVAAADTLALERVALLEGMATHDPRLAMEQLDIRHMALDSALVAGDPASVIVLGRRFAADGVAGELTHFIRRSLVVAHTLLGDFETALAQAAAMRRGWERAGRPGARWMAPGALAAALACGLRGEEAARAEWNAFAARLARGGSADFKAFTEARLALHRGEVEAAAELAAAGAGPSSRWPGYLSALRVEIAAAQHQAGIPQRAAEVRASFDHQPWAEAVLMRAEARASGQPADWQRAADAFSAIGARFEWVCTLAGARAGAAAEVERDDGAAVWTTLGCEPPAI